VLIQTVKV